MSDPTYKNLARIKDNTNDVIYQIKATGLEASKTVALTGDVTGSASTDFTADVSISSTIATGAVTESKIATDAVTNSKVKDGELTKAKFNANVYNEVDGTIADGTNANLATKTQVKAYVESVISSEGHYKGVQSVATINTWTAANLHNGDRVITSSDPAGSGTGTLTLGNLPVVDGQEVIFYVSDDQSVKIWQSSEGNYKIKQASKSDPTASGTTIEAIDSITQNTNGEITATKKTIRSGTTSQTGVVQLKDSIAASESDDSKAATPKAVRDAINALDGNATSTDGTNVQVKVTSTDGIVSAVNITTDNTENKNNKVTSWTSTTTDTHYPSEKLVKDSLDGKADKVTGTFTADNFAALDANGNIKDSGHKSSDYKTVQTAKTDPTASGVSLTFIDTISQNTNGEITATKRTVDVLSTYASDGTKPVNGTAVAAALATLDAEVTSTDGTNVQAKVTEVDGKITGVSITTDNTENINNKVITLSASSTDTEYPSAKCVYDALQGIDTDAETKYEVIAEALDDLDARTRALENIDLDVLGDAVADSLDTQVLKVGGEQIDPTKISNAIQGVKVNNVTLTPDANKVVSIPTASSSGHGTVQFMTSQEASDLWAAAWAAASAT